MSAQAANDAALARLFAVRPHWQRVVRARDAIGLPDFTLLHAGPPYADPCNPAAPVMSSAVLCCLYEKWASTQAQAEHLIASGHVKLLSAQSFGVVTPLAAVISPAIDTRRSRGPARSVAPRMVAARQRRGRADPLRQSSGWRAGAARVA